MSTDNFQWNEALVKEVVRIAHKDGYHSIQETNLDNLISDFKASKQTKQERIEVELSGGALPGSVLLVKPPITISILGNQFPAIKQAIESVLNNDTVVERGIQDEFDAPRMYLQSEVDAIRRETWEAARRWANGMWSNQLFPVGKNSQFKYPFLTDYLSSLNSKEDKPTQPSNELKPPIGLMPRWLWIEKRIEDIDSAIERYKDCFKKIPQEWIDERYDLKKSQSPAEDKPSPSVNDNLHVENFDDNLSKTPPIVKDKEVLLITDDGVEIKDKHQIIYHVTDDFKITPRHAVTGGFPGRNFSSPEAAEQYIVNNKPCLSLLEVLQFVDAACHPAEENFREYELRDYLKKKLFQ